jgi:hypothetical protein
VRRAALAAATAVLIAVPAAGQTTSPPGPWVVDVRAVTSAAPTDVAFYPPTLTSTVVPSRGFGGDFGGHVYLFALGPARVGLGGSVMMVRGTATGPATAEEGAAPVDGQRVTLSMRVIAPQISFNFGSRDGWSYLSAGLGVGRISTEVDGVTGGDRQSGQRRAVNFGGGARWFIKPRLAFSLDLRALQISAGDGMPRTSVFTVGAGLSIR